jgi:uncharacterized repeat protein (TIGR03803 family)
MGSVKTASFAALAATLLLPVCAHAQAFSVLHSFAGGSDGAYPYAGLLNVGGTLFGTTEEGGTANFGTVFQINAATGVETVVYSFAGGRDGDSPLGGLLNVGSVLYGTTSGYIYGSATIFKVDPATGAETVLHNFNASDGAQALSALSKVGGWLFGTTVYGGGASNSGTVFKLNLKTGIEMLVYSFTGAGDGGNPYAALLDVGGILYGTTYGGGSGGMGTVFTINPRTGAERVLHAFQGGSADGAEPVAALINAGGILYGTTGAGGASEAGTVFTIDPTSGAVSVIHSFADGSDGADPGAALLYARGRLYGTTVGGGMGGGLGTVFTLNPATGAELVLHAFSGGDGEFLHGPVVEVGKRLYGTAYQGGASSIGTVFSQKP